VALEPFLQRLFLNYHAPRWIASDPLSLAHRYESPEDRETAAWFAATFAYGSAKQIIPAVEKVLVPLGAHPAQAVAGYGGERLWPGFYYRFHKEGHLMAWVATLRELRRRYGSLEAVFTPDGAGERTIEKSLNGAAQRIQAVVDDLAVAPELRRGLRFLVNSPATGTACKRVLMFLRWMVRRDVVDLGLWTVLKPEDLAIPLDTHVARLSHYLGLRSTPEARTPNWAMVLEVTDGLRQVDARDPVRFDFALSRLGILSLCVKRYERTICESCELKPACRYSKVRLEMNK
jgi:uncharacterized protein (TIGR02757 family)